LFVLYKSAKNTLFVIGLESKWRRWKFGHW